MNFDTPLCEIAYKYGVDRCPQLGHGYTPFYYEMFKDRRESVKKVVELGVGSRNIMVGAPSQYVTGAGLFMWREFFPNAQIFGVDIDSQAQVEDERIQTFLLDQRKKEDLNSLIKKVAPDVDLFIDDACHYSFCQIPTCLALMPRLEKGVTYVIEDILNAGRIMKHHFRGYDCQIFSASDRIRDWMLVVRHK